MVGEMIWTRKLGVFELLVGMVAVELVFGSKLRALCAAVFAVVAWYCKAKFGGEFSLAQAWAFVTGAAKDAADRAQKL